MKVIKKYNFPGLEGEVAIINDSKFHGLFYACNKEIGIFARFSNTEQIVEKQMIKEINSYLGREKSLLLKKLAKIKEFPGEKLLQDTKGLQDYQTLETKSGEEK